MMTDTLDILWRRERAWLGYAGLFPFAAALVALVSVTDPAGRTLAIDVMRYYSAVIASFLGAVHWGVAVLDPDMRRARLRWGVMPALIAWTLLLLPPTAALPGFVVLFAAILYVDWHLLPLPDEHYRPLRAQLSAGVILVLTVASLLLGGIV